jgi:prepilin-type N-terminal cleavage/methylation domain-containing protein
MRHPTVTTRPRRGFTLVEMMLSMTLLLIALGISMPFFMAQSRALAAHAGRLDAQLSIDFGLYGIDRDLRVAGVGVVPNQPVIVQASPTAVTFNADLTSNVTGDFGAVYYDPDADARTVRLLRPADRITLPNSSAKYPDSTYVASPGVPSSAETISYWVEADTGASQYRLMRRVNNAAPAVVARGLLLPDREPAFRYFKLDASGQLVEIPTSQLPIMHFAGYHGTPGDSAGSALTDSIRLVKMRFTARFKDPRSAAVTRTEERSVRIANSGMAGTGTCGETPLAVAAAVAMPTPGPSVGLTWAASKDEAAGEKDVERYAVYRRLDTEPAFGEPIAGVAAGLATYVFKDTDVRSGQRYIYGVAAQDCTPSMSSIVQSPIVLVP